MLTRNSILLALMFGLLATGVASAGEVRMPGTDVVLDAPSGFAAGGRAGGLTNRDGTASVTANVLRGGIGNFKAGLTDERLAAKGMRVRSREALKIDDRDAILLLIAQRAGDVEYRKWMLVFGDAAECVLIVATFPRADERKLKDPLRRALLSAHRASARATDAPTPEAPEAPEEPGLPETAGFKLSPEKPIVFAKIVKGVHFFTRGGVHPPRHAADPVISVSKVAGTVAQKDREKHAKELVGSWPGLTGVKVETVAARTIDGLGCIELTGRATDRETDTLLRIHLVAVFADDAVWIIRARGLLNREPPYLPTFKKAARTFKRRRP